MTDLDRYWSLSNSGPERLLVWLEPWAEEFEVPVRSTITLHAPRGADGCTFDEVEWTPDHLVVWASAPGTVEVFVDGVLQESGSAAIPIPEGLTKQMLNVVFAGEPAARLGGRTFAGTELISWWQWAQRRLGL